MLHHRSMEKQDAQLLPVVRGEESPGSFDIMKSPTAKAFCKVCLPILLFGMLLSLVGWDLHKVKELSDIIHDDHRDIWEVMNKSSVSLWFTPLDMCMLDQSDSPSNLLLYRQRNCTKQTGGRGVSQARLFCGIGSSLGEQCSTPLNSKVFFRSRLREPGLGDPSNGYLRRALRRIAASRKPLVFLGDAISRQNHDALICELLRTDKITISGGFGSRSNSTESNVTIHWRESSLRLNVVFLHMVQILSHSNSISAVYDTANDQDSSHHKEYSDAFLGVEGGGAAGAAAGAAAAGGSAVASVASGTAAITGAPAGLWATYLRPGRRARAALAGNRSSGLPGHPGQPGVSGGLLLQPPLSSSSSSGASNASTDSTFGREIQSSSLGQVERRLNSMVQEHTGFVLITNIGVWYNTRERFRAEIPYFIQLLAEFGDQNLILFRETSAQHWNLSTHGYFANGASPADGECVPLADSTPEFDWRNRDTKHCIEKLDAESTVNVVPFRDITAPLFDMHPDRHALGSAGSTTTDCTRFCYFPQMWQSVWKALDVLTINSTKLHRPARALNLSTALYQ